MNTLIIQREVPDSIHEPEEFVLAKLALLFSRKVFYACNSLLWVNLAVTFGSTSFVKKAEAAFTYFKKSGTSREEQKKMETILTQYKSLIQKKGKKKEEILFMKKTETAFQIIIDNFEKNMERYFHAYNFQSYKNFYNDALVAELVLTHRLKDHSLFNSFNMVLAGQLVKMIFLTETVEEHYRCAHLDVAMETDEILYLPMMHLPLLDHLEEDKLKYVREGTLSVLSPFLEELNEFLNELANFSVCEIKELWEKRKHFCNTSMEKAIESVEQNIFIQQHKSAYPITPIYEIRCAFSSYKTFLQLLEKLAVTKHQINMIEDDVRPYLTENELFVFFYYKQILIND